VDDHPRLRWDDDFSFRIRPRQVGWIQVDHVLRARRPEPMRGPSFGLAGGASAVEGEETEGQDGLSPRPARCTSRCGSPGRIRRAEPAAGGLGGLGLLDPRGQGRDAAPSLPYAAGGERSLPKRREARCLRSARASLRKGVCPLAGFGRAPSAAGRFLRGRGSASFRLRSWPMPERSACMLVEVGPDSVDFARAFLRGRAGSAMGYRPGVRARRPRGASRPGRSGRAATRWVEIRGAERVGAGSGRAGRVRWGVRRGVAKPRKIGTGAP